MNNIPDRALLKNLGHWLGIITIAKNKPILATVRMRIAFQQIFSFSVVLSI
jgi:hypothetical protein